MPDHQPLAPLPGIDALTVGEETRSLLRDLSRAVGGGPLVAVFSGPSGSGKTTGARAVAGEAGSPLHRIDLSPLESTYIGETEKNIGRALARAEEAGAILLLDEADALFGGNSTDAEAAERLLDRIASHPGTTIIELRTAAPALARRFRVIGFPAPDVAPARKINGVDTGRTAFVGSAATGPFDEPIAVTGIAGYTEVFGDRSLAHPMSHAVAQFFDNGGRNAVVVRVPCRSGHPDAPIATADLIAPALEATDQGIWALRLAGGFSVLCIPPLGPGDEVEPLTRLAALGLCVEQRAFLVLDPPNLWGTATDVDPADLFPPTVDVAAVRCNAAVYWPHIVAPDPANGGLPGLFAPAGAVAGIYARTDHARGVWKAPAGTTATVSALGVEPAVSDSDQAGLNPLGVNAIRMLPGVGTVVWGARTLDGDNAVASEWKYVPVRRTALYLERSIEEGLQWAVFEPNGETLWAQVRRSVETFLHDVFRQGGLAGATPDQAYFVRCDRTTTTQADIDSGVANLVVGFAPMRPAEFVVITVPFATAASH